MPACFVTQQLRGSFIQVSRGCGSKIEYERARFACRQGPEKCPLIGRCDKNGCQAALPYYCGKSQKYMATANMWTNEYLFRFWATFCMKN
ncbi:hypothetical protein P5673_017550 [Acropora cervicornis]|uniref:Uncharacterized protein n=2 Tax=Acropora TaxID=6127 RepID=A0AAD9V423_ACRCE|nr:hypothetical protein P5673_017550 [Acropora cervicornis]